MNPVPELAPYLKQLRLSGILDSLEARNRQALDSKLAYTEFLALLIQDEVARREQKKFALRLRRAAFRASKTLEQFDFERLPQLNRTLVHELATGRYLADRIPVLIVGPCGTGKIPSRPGARPLRRPTGRGRRLHHLRQPHRESRTPRARSAPTTGSSLPSPACRC